MKKFIAIALSLVLVVTIGVLLINDSPEQSYIRIHIRANSNNEIDQNVKYLVKDKVVSYITPLATEITSFDDMYSTLEKNLDKIKSTVDKTLADNNFDYTSSVKLNRENFPARTYENLTLGEGVYDALIIELGSGSGDNWWCVAFPPLCFTQGEDAGETIYKSKFKEWFDKLNK